MIKRIFLHGLDSSGRGTKGTYFSTRYPDIERPDFDGTLQQWMTQLYKLLGEDTFIAVGSSFGGLMGTVLAVEKPDSVHRLILLAPALNSLQATAGVLVFVEIDLLRNSPDAFRDFRREALKLPELLECHLVSGNFDYLLKARVRDMKQYRELLGEKILALPGATRRAPERN